MQVDAIKPFFPAVYGPDVSVDLHGPDADYELDSVLKQAHFQLANADRSEQALAGALATLLITDDPANVCVDMSDVSEGVEEQLMVRTPPSPCMWTRHRRLCCAHFSEPGPAQLPR